MIEVSDEQFQQLIDAALDSLPGEHAANVKNVAILYAEEPSPEQLQNGDVHPGYTLLGLYEGLPLTQRQGSTRIYPDRITLFKGPLTRMASNMDDLREQIRHTLWHEIAHYYGLNHDQIHGLE
ncbi:MAG TPA: metallopeptidase family protein [Candidatus Saccharimonadales bacterium]|nr:metallopeptidase family protein [Candidatus Saccharimonadales bacterium]